MYGFISYLCHMKSHIITSEHLSFIFAGNSVFTVKNVETDNRFTFKVKKHKKDDIFFVSVLTGPENFTFIGSIRRDSEYRHSRKSVIGTTATSVRAFDFIIRKLHNNTLPEKIQVWHEGKCGRCGRTLTVPESILTGFGPECSKKV